MHSKHLDFNRRDFVRLTACGAAALAWPQSAAAEGVEKQTFIYKKAGKLELQADVYNAGPRASGRPTVIWIHGGALILGSRTGIIDRLRQRLLAKDWTIVSIDYRLAPETKLPAILEDLQDAWRMGSRPGAAAIRR